MGLFLNAGLVHVEHDGLEREVTCARRICVATRPLVL